MLKDYFEVPNKPAIKSGNILSCDFTDHETFIPQPLDYTRGTIATYVDCNGLIKTSGVSDTELVINGDFSDGLNGWSSHNGSILELQDGKAKVTTVGNQGWIKRTDLPIQSGKTYFCKAEITNALNPTIFINGTQNQLNPMPLISGNLYGGYITTTGNDATFYIRGNNTDGEVSLIDNVSVKEVDLNVPRIDYTTEIGKAKELQKPSLLFEPQSTNYFRFSEDFAQTYWSKQNNPTVNSNQTISPEGIQNADALVSANATSEQYIYNSTVISVTSGDDVTISCFVKKLDYDYFHLRFTATGSVFTAASVWYNISNGTLGTVETGITAKIEDYGNGWYRCSATRRATGTGSGRVRLQLASADNTAFVTGDGTKGTFVYGAQFEIQRHVTSYIPTSGSTVTRNGEICNNAGQLGVFNDTEGVLYLEAKALINGGVNREITLTSGASTNIIRLRYSSTTSRFEAFLRGGGGTIQSLSRSALTQDVYRKIALVYDSNEFAMWIDGSKQSFVSTTNLPIGLNEFEFELNGASFFYGKVREVKVFRRALTDSELTELTNNIV